MAFIFSDGFDSAVLFSDIADRWDSGPSVAAGFIATGGRTGGPCLEGTTNSLSPPAKHLFPALAQPAGAALFVSSSVRFSAFPTGVNVRNIWHLFNERVTPSTTETTNRTLSTTSLTLIILANGTLQFLRQNTIVATGTIPMALNTWYRLEIKVANIDDSGGVFEARINGVVDISVTNVDLWAAGSKEISCVSPGTACRHDDVIIHDSTGSTFNDYLGDLLIETIRPNAAGTTTQSTPLAGAAYAAVDDVSADFDATYTAINTVNNFDTYAYANMASTPASILGVVVSTLAASPGLTPRKIKNLAKLSETTVQGAERLVLADLTSAYRMEQDAYLTKPGGGAWTKADVDAAEFGWIVTQ